jgi:C-terminal processing protease CtpA/Prc
LIRPDEELPTHRSSYTFNGNHKVVAAQLEGITECGKFAAVGRTKADGFGYFMLMQQSAANRENVRRAAEAIKKLYDAPGFIVDLRSGNGGSEPLALEIAQLFAARKRCMPAASIAMARQCVHPAYEYAAGLQTHI